MKISLSPIEYAAIATAGVALLLILIVIAHHIYRHFHPRTPSHSRSQNQTPQPNPRRTTFTTFGGFGYNFGQPQSTIPLPIAESPSTGHTTLVTPVGSGKLKKNGVRGISPDVEMAEVENEELVVVTYEEGLAKLGMGMVEGMGDRPHHILYPDPPSFEEVAGMEVYSPGSGGSGVRTTPGRAGLGAGNGRWGERLRDERNGRVRPPRIDNAREGEAVGLQRNGTLQSSWLPSYYHTDHRGREREDETSDLGYRAGPAIGSKGTRYAHRI